MKWTLAEGMQELLKLESISDLGTNKHQFCLDVSITDVSTEEGKGISVILSTQGNKEYLHFSSEKIWADEEETMYGLIVRVADMMGINPVERIWEDGAKM